MTLPVSGLDQKRLSKLGNWIQECVNTKKFSGASVTVFRKNQLAYESYHGYQDIDTQKRITKDTVFRIYSMTKPIVSCALMMLYEDGRFKLTDPIGMYIPSLSNKNLIGIYDYNKNTNKMKLNEIKTLPIKQEILIYHLLTHTSGLSYGFDKFGLIEPVDKLYNQHKCFGHNNKMSLEYWIDNCLSKMPLLFQPGTNWNYSLSTDVIGRLIEVLSGIQLDQFLYQKIFKPLKMNNTSFYFDEIENKENIATLYIPSYAMTPNRKYIENYKLIKGEFANSYNKMDQYLSGGGGLVSTLSDYLNFAKMLLNDGELFGEQILSRKTIEYMTMNHLSKNKDMFSMLTDRTLYSELNRPGIGFGLGFSVILNNDSVVGGRRASDGSGQLSSIGSYGWGGAADTFFWIDPKEDLTVVFMTQLLFNDRTVFDIRSRLQTLVYSSFVDKRVRSKL
eukprot:122842_1